MFNLFGHNARRSRLIKTAAPSPLRNYLECTIPGRNTLANEVSLLAVDFETTGLNPKNDEILSIGFVEIKNFKIDLSTATHLLIKSNSPLSRKTVVIHKITDDQIIQGVALKVAIDTFLRALGGKIMVAHHAKIESAFLNKACKQVYDGEIIIPVIDTLKIELGRLPEHKHDNNHLNLSNCSKRYNLPKYKLHDALSDALSCAELFLAQLAHGSSRDLVRLNQMLSYLP